MKKSFVLFLLLFAGMVGFAQLQTAPQWTRVLSDQPETFRTQLISSSENSIKVNVQVPGFYTTNVTTPRGEAKIVSMPKAVSTAKAGEPNVPMTGIPAIIGDQARMGIRVIDAQYMDFEGIEVAPSKGDFPRTIDPATVPYTYGACYSQDAFFPASNVGLYDPYIVRDFRGQNMVVYPYAYNPVTKTLRVYYDMTVEMYKVDNNGSNVMETRRSNTVKMDPDFKSMYQRHFINYQAAMNRYTPVDEEGDLLIICYDNFISSMTDFVNWKKTRGVNTTIVGTSTAGSTESAIKNYIQSQYNANNNLTHVLLVGDDAQIPGYTYTGGGSSYGGKGDNPYGQVAGNDIYNDIFVGRFSAQTAAQVTTQVNRVITYERDLTTSATWLQNADGIAKKEGGAGHNNEDDYQHMDVIRDDLFNYGYNNVYQDYANLSGYTGTATSISSHINSGVGIVNYCNHGNTQLWGVASYSNVQVNALTNANKLPFIWSVACLVGKYDNTSTSYGSGYTVGQANDCFAEAWMHATYSNSDLTPTGAVGALMSYISQPWIPPMWAQDECVDILCELESNNIKHTWGGTSINGIMGIFDHYSTSEISAVGTYQAWILYGDPTMMLRTKTPQAMTVTHAGNIGLGVTSYSVNVSNGNGALATITDANHNILGKATVSNGVANITLSSNTTPGTELTLCVFGYNKVTYLGTIEVVGGEQYSITATANPSNAGTVTGGGLLYESTTCTLTAVANSGWDFVNWNDGSTENPRSFTVTGPASFTANFTTVPERTITLASVMHGTISCDHSTAYKNDIITLNANPASGYNLENWVVFKTGDVNTTITVSNNQFTMPNYDVTVSAIFSKPAGGDVNIGSGTSTNAYLPTYAWYSYTLSQQIYKPSEIGSAGTITKVAFKVSNSKSASRTIDIYMSHTSTNAFSGNSAWIAQSNSYRVFSGDVTFNASGWTTITLDTPFQYNGTSNLLLTVDDNTGSYVGSSGDSPVFYVYSTSGNTALYKYNDGTDYNPASMNTSGTTLQVNNQVVFTKEVPSTEGYLSVSPTNLSDFEADAGFAPSEPQVVSVIGNNLQTNLTVTAPNGYEICTTNNGHYSGSLTLTPSDGSLRANVYVRLGSDVNPGNYNGNLTLVSGATTATISLSGTVIDTGQQYAVTVTANPAEGGDVTGAGEYDYGTSVTVTATANEGYTFTNWTLNGTEVSTEASYDFTVTGATELVANFTLNSYEVTVAPCPIVGGSVAIDGVENETAGMFLYDFEDGTLQGWTVLQGSNGDSPNSWMHCTNYAGYNYSTGQGHNASNGFVLSESFVFTSPDDEGTAVHPDNYLVSPRVLLGGSISFWATNAEDGYGAEHFAVAVSTDGNADVNDFEQVQEWTLGSKAERTGNTRNIGDGTWYEYSVDLSSFVGFGYVAIHHFDCYEQWLLCVDDITIMEGAPFISAATFNHGENCTVTATANEGYAFVNWTENGVEVSTEPDYSFVVTSNRDLVANFEEQAAEVEKTVTLTQGLNWWSTNLDITLDQLKDAIAAAVGNTGTATIKSQSGSISLTNGNWRPVNMPFDIRQMYQIQVSADCEITLSGVPVNPSEYEITIHNGVNWIGFLPAESMSVDEAFSGLNPAIGDVIKSKEGSSSYSGSIWRGSVQTLEPGQGYIYQSTASDDKTFTFGANAK